jgi:hypothetical protein
MSVQALSCMIRGGAVVFGTDSPTRRDSAAIKWAVATLLLSYAAIATAAPPQQAAATSGERPLLPSFEKQQRLTEQMIRTEVEQELRDARTRIATEPAEVQRNLALLAGRIARTPGLNIQTRTQLRGQIARVVREAHRRALAQQSNDRAKAAKQGAAAAERQRIELTVQEQQRVQQMVDRFDGLIDDGQYEQARQVGENDLRLIGPGAEVSVSAPLVADAIEKGDRARELSKQRAEGLADFYASEERSAIPFDDSRPIRFPDAEAWRRLTNWRREHFAPHNKRFSAQEIEIRKQLQENTEVDFDNTQLRDVASYLSDRHGIQVQLDNVALDWVGITGETPVTRKVKDVRLQSALRLILRDFDLTYLVIDDVLLITTPERAANATEIRVYPVEDLVTPKEPLMPFGFF